MRRLIASVGLIALLFSTPSFVSAGKFPDLSKRPIVSTFVNGLSIINYYPYVDGNGEVINPNDFEYAVAFPVDLNCKPGEPYALMSYKYNEIIADRDFDGRFETRYKIASIDVLETMMKHIYPICSAVNNETTS